MASTSGQRFGQINDKAIEYFDKFRKSGVKEAEGGIKEQPKYRIQIRQILRQVERLDVEQQTFVLNQLGVQPIWYFSHNQIPNILKVISREDSKKRKINKRPKKAPRDLARPRNTQKDDSKNVLQMSELQAASR